MPFIRSAGKPAGQREKSSLITAPETVPRLTISVLGSQVSGKMGRPMVGSSEKKQRRRRDETLAPCVSRRRVVVVFFWGGVEKGKTPGYEKE